jgi:predicted MFS family arabinose efflux permease
VIAQLADALRSLGRVLRNPEIRRVELAWMLGWASEWAWLVALWVYAFRASGVVAVGVLGLARTLPAALLAPALSTLSDRLPRHRVLLGVHLGRGLVLALVALAVASGAPPLVVYLLAPLDALLGVLHRPTHMPLLPALARSPEDLVAANVASSSFEGIGTLVGPAVGGILVATAAPAWGFVIPALGFWLAALSVSGVRPAQALRLHPDRPDLLHTMLGGIRALVDYPSAGLVVALFWSQVVVRGLLNVLVVLAAEELLHIGQEGVGYLYSAIGAGSLLGALGAVALVGRRRMAPSFAAGLVLWGAPILMIGLIPLAGPAVFFLVVLGLGNATLDVSGFTIVQRTVPNAVRGRVFGVLEAGIMLSTGIGSALAPLLVLAAGARGALIITGAILPSLAVLSWHWVSRADARGVIPERQLALLRGVPMLAPLPLTVLEQVASEVIAVRFAAGVAIITQGDVGDRFYILAEGEAEATVDGKSVRHMGPGEFFGEIALLRDVPRTATVTAVDAVLAYALNRDAFLAAVTGDRQSSSAAAAVVEDRLGAA